MSICHILHHASAHLFPLLRKLARTVYQLAIVAEQNVLNSGAQHSNHILLLIGLFHVSTFQIADPGRVMQAILLQTVLANCVASRCTYVGLASVALSHV